MVAGLRTCSREWRIPRTLQRGEPRFKPMFIKCVRCASTSRYSRRHVVEILEADNTYDISELEHSSPE